MSDSPNVIQLVEEALDSGRQPEDICSDCPHLLDEVRRRVDRCREINSRLDLLFSPPGSEAGTYESSPIISLPQIPHYQVQAVIGEGGMGVVYSAWHTKLKRLVALKMLRSGTCALPAELRRFSLEAEAVAGLQHPHIVQIYDQGEVDGRPFFTMEYLEGGNLAEMLGEATLLPGKAAGYLVNMASAMDAAHRAGIVHRDLKPANILFGSDGQLKISDFGLARRITSEDGLTFGGARVGTPSYMAPEQAAGRTSKIGPSADIYALGAILYEMLTGRPPFRGSSVADTERQVISDDPASPRRLNTSVPRDLETICLKCLRKDPIHRYATAADLGADVERYLGGEPIHARRIGPVGRAVKWTRRRPTQAVLITATLLLVIGISATVMWYLSTRSARTRIVVADLNLVDGPNGFESQGRWNEARAALERASLQLGDRGPTEVRLRLEKDNRHLELVAQLDSIELNLANVEGNPSQSEIEDAFRPIFTAVRFDLFTRDKAAAEMEVKTSPIRVALVAALNDWAFTNQDEAQSTWLRDVASASNENPTQWESQLCDPKAWEDRQTLRKIAAAAPIDKEPVSTLVQVGRYLAIKGPHPSLEEIAFMTEIQQHYPTDFWANMILGEAEYKAERYLDAIRYFQVAVALRSTAATPEFNLACALFKAGRDNEGLVHSQIALTLGSGFAANGNLKFLAIRHAGEIAAQMEREKGRQTEEQTGPHALEKLVEVGHIEDAIFDDYNSAFGVDAINRLETRSAKWKVSLDSNPPGYASWSGYAELCLYLHHDDEYRRTRTRLLERFGDATDPHTAERAGRACLLLSGSDEEIRKAAALVDRAVKADPSKLEPWAPDFFLVAKALAEFRQGHLTRTSKILSGSPSSALRPVPQLIMAMVLQQQGKSDSARSLCAQAEAMFDWNPNRATNADAWMFHVLRRQARKMILTTPPTTAP